MDEFQLESYLSRGVERIVKEIIKVSGAVPGKGLFFLRFAAAEKKARVLRQHHESKGTHIPPFLIASITTGCNLQCKGCYAHANGCGDASVKQELTQEQWSTIFRQAKELGICFILLAGGEPMTRIDVLTEASRHKHILFPVFTNGTLLDEAILQLLSKNHNLLPILSIEGGKETTDARRGMGVYEQIKKAMEQFTYKHILFGASITVTTENQEQVLSDAFIAYLKKCGCKALIYVEYVPVDKKSTSLALKEEQRSLMASRLQYLRNQEKEILFISFPGDEKASAGCLAAGRGFFHINAFGNAEPCPFSPYSDTDVIHTELKETLNSPLFLKLRLGTLLTDDHQGGCVLFEKEEQVKDCLKGVSS